MLLPRVINEARAVSAHALCSALGNTHVLTLRQSADAHTHAITLSGVQCGSSHRVTGVNVVIAERIPS